MQTKAALDNHGRIGKTTARWHMENYDRRNGATVACAIFELFQRHPFDSVCFTS